MASCNATCTGAGTTWHCGDGQVCPEYEACDDEDVSACGLCNATCSGPGSDAITCDDFPNRCGVIPLGCGSIDCGDSCPSGRTCAGNSCCSLINGGMACSCLGSTPSSIEICGGACVDTELDAAHCGQCNNACGSGNQCFEGACVTEDDYLEDRDNCGGCGNRCADTGCGFLRLFECSCNEGACEQPS